MVPKVHWGKRVFRKKKWLGMSQEAIRPKKIRLKVKFFISHDKKNWGDQAK